MKSYTLILVLHDGTVLIQPVYREMIQRLLSFFLLFPCCSTSICIFSISCCHNKGSIFAITVAISEVNDDIVGFQ